MDVEACGKCVKWSLLFCDVLAMVRHCVKIPRNA